MYVCIAFTNVTYIASLYRYQLLRYFSKINCILYFHTQAKCGSLKVSGVEKDTAQRKVLAQAISRSMGRDGLIQVSEIKYKNHLPNGAFKIFMYC